MSTLFRRMQLDMDILQAVAHTPRRLSTMVSEFLKQKNGVNEDELIGADRLSHQPQADSPPNAEYAATGPKLLHSTHRTSSRQSPRTDGARSPNPWAQENSLINEISQATKT